MIEHFQVALDELSSLVGNVALGSYSDEELRAAVLEWESRDARNSGRLAEEAMSALEYQLAVVGLAGSRARGYSESTELVANELRTLQRLRAALPRNPRNCTRRRSSLLPSCDKPLWESGPFE